jgi:hypothetical protein
LIQSDTYEVVFDQKVVCDCVPYQQVLEVLVNLAAVKRPLFSPNEKTDYFTRFARLVSTVLSTQLGLSNQECFHQVLHLGKLDGPCSLASQWYPAGKHMRLVSGAKCQFDATAGSHFQYLLKVVCIRIVLGQQFGVIEASNGAVLLTGLPHVVSIAALGPWEHIGRRNIQLPAPAYGCVHNDIRQGLAGMCYVSYRNEANLQYALHECAKSCMESYSISMQHRVYGQCVSRVTVDSQ